MSRFIMHINRAALKYNFDRAKELAGSSKILAVVKSNAYGHGLVATAKVLGEADAFGVASLEEAQMLREAGIEKPIVLMSCFYTFQDLYGIVQLDTEIVVYDFSQILALENTPLPKPIAVWLKINSGMNRLGFSPYEVEEAYERLTHCPNVKLPLKLMTHFSDADDPKNPKTLQQIETFQNVIQNLVGERSLSNSAGLFAFPKAHADWVRPGLMLYGCSPFVTSCGQDLDLRPVMTVYSQLMAVRHQRKNDTIGYSSTFRCPENMPIGIIAMGYGEGYPRQIKSGTPVLINGYRCPIIGRVSMNMLAIDLREQDHAKVGDLVMLWGDALPVEEVAKCAGTIAYDLLCSLNPLPKKMIFSA